jgi:Rrf2 family protein
MNKSLMPSRRTMTLSQTAEHALRAVLYLARQPNADRIPADVIAEALAAPRNYLSKTLGALTKAGVVTSARGPHGGFRLAVPATELSLARVIGPFGESSGSPVCVAGGRRCDSLDPCSTHERWSAVQAELMAPMERTTIADLLGAPKSGEALSGSGAR